MNLPGVWSPAPTTWSVSQTIQPYCGLVFKPFGAALSKQLLSANQNLEAANAKLEDSQAHLIETERLASIAFQNTLRQIHLRSEERKSSEDSLRESEERYALAVQGANDGVWDWKFDKGEIYLSPRWNQIL